MSIPAHYDKPVTPWCLERHMESSGDAFVDARRTDAIEYCFRMKGDLLGDLIKARHCLDAVIDHLSGKNLRTAPPAPAAALAAPQAQVPPESRPS